MDDRFDDWIDADTDQTFDEWCERPRGAVRGLAALAELTTDTAHSGDITVSLPPIHVVGGAIVTTSSGFGITIGGSQG